jgi:hypothetical protein
MKDVKIYVLQNEAGQYARLDNNFDLFWHENLERGHVGTGNGTFDSPDKKYMEELAAQYGGKVVEVLTDWPMPEPAAPLDGKSLIEFFEKTTGRKWL